MAAQAALLQLARQARGQGDKRNVARVLEGVQAVATGDLRLWADASLSQVVSCLAREAQPEPVAAPPPRYT
ncbi:hypothetical protein DIPPA_03834 [Diplonema papillatum]|nr:hypothetical protein DIPPA_03834 [Diplonema papillatum]